MIKNNKKIVFYDSTGTEIIFTNFKLYNINYTFDIYTNRKEKITNVNQVCFNKADMVKLYIFIKKYLENTLGDVIDLEIYDFDSPSYIKIKNNKDKLLTFIFMLTFPQEIKDSLVLEKASLSSVLINLKSILLDVDNLEEESKTKELYGLNFSIE